MGKRWTAADIERVQGRGIGPNLQAVMQKRRYRYYIGIDCGVKTGLAIWDSPEKKFFLLEAVKIHIALVHVNEWHKAFSRDGVMVRIEDARLRKIIPWSKNPDKAAAEREERGRREGAGSVKRDATIWEDMLTDIGMPFEMIAPRDNVTKVTQEFFRMATGHQAVTNEHERDAGMLVYSL